MFYSTPIWFVGKLQRVSYKAIPVSIIDCTELFKETVKEVESIYVQSANTKQKDISAFYPLFNMSGGDASVYLQGHKFTQF